MKNGLPAVDPTAKLVSPAHQVKKKAGREGPTFWDCLKFDYVLSERPIEGKQKALRNPENKGF
jgi:hypothetical protein